MSIALQCDQCGRRYALKDELAGKSVKCKGCGKVLRAPALPDRPAARVKAQAPPPMPASPPALDLYGLDDLPVARASASEDGDEAPPPPRPGASTRSRTREEQRSFEKRVRAKDRDRPSFAQPLFGVSFGAVMAVALIGVRVYLRLARPFRNDNRVGSTAPENPRPPRTVGPITTPAFPELGPGASLQRGVRFHEVRLGPDNPAPESPGHRGKLWLYLPDGEHSPASLACVVIAGAGSNLITGMNLGDGDRPEHLPYVHAGIAVLAYELDGAVEDREDLNAIIEASGAFLAAQAGLVNARNALDFLASRVPEVDPERIYTVGHSSAGTMALVLTENEPRIKGCVAFAPVVDMTKRIPPGEQAMFATVVPGSAAFFSLYNPKMHEDAIRCPLMLFHAQDDSNVPVSESVDCKARLEQLGRPVTLVTVPTGDHHDAMIRQGIPRAIAWLKGLDPAR